VKVIAAISAFFFIALAAMFGANASPIQADLWQTVLSILFFVAGTALVMGIVFGRAAMRVTTLFGGLALFTLWLPLQMFATDESLIRSGIALLLTISTLALFFFVGVTARKFVAEQICDAN
jgi:hypothetical protein